MPLLNLPNETLHHIASFLPSAPLLHLILTSRFLSTLLTPLLHKHAIKPRGSKPALFWAVMRRHESLIRLLLQKGVDVNMRHNLGTGHEAYPTALHLASAFSLPSIVKLLLDAGADPNATSDATHDLNSTTPMMLAVWWCSTDKVRLLLEAGANTNGRYKGEVSILHAAAGWMRDVEMVDFLLSTGADVSARDRFGNTPLHFACADEEEKEWHLGPDIVKLLLGAGADVNARNSRRATPLFGLVDGLGGIPEAKEILKMLRKEGVDINATDINHETAFETMHRWNSRRSVVGSPMRVDMKIWYEY